DVLGDAIGKDIAAIAASATATSDTLVIDPFAGSGNTLYWILRHLPGARGLGFELDAAVFGVPTRNVSALVLAINILKADYCSGLATVPVAADQLLITFIAPPWGEALSHSSGLDLRLTRPPITEIVDFLIHRFEQNRLLCAIQIYETVVPASLVEL